MYMFHIFNQRTFYETMKLKQSYRKANSFSTLTTEYLKSRALP